MAFWSVLWWVFSLWSLVWAQQPSTSLLYIYLRFDTMNYVQEMAPFVLTRPFKYLWEDICPQGVVFPSLYIHSKPLMSLNWRARGSWTALSLIWLRFSVQQGHTYFLLPGPWHSGSSLAGSKWWNRSLMTQDVGLPNCVSEKTLFWRMALKDGPWTSSTHGPSICWKPNLELFLNLLN